MSTRTFLLGAISGAAAMYLLDPHAGQARRRDAEERAKALAETPVAKRVTGQVMEVTRPLRKGEPVSGAQLADEVRTRVLGREEFADLVINLDAHERTITLRGVVDDQQLADRLIEEVRSVEDVEQVESYLHAASDPVPEHATIR